MSATRTRAPVARSAPTTGSKRWAPLAAAALIAGVAIATYLPTLSAGFVWDDHFIVEANTQIRSLADVPALFSSHAFSGTTGALGGDRLVEYYRPVWTLSLAIDHALWALKPLGYHLTNVLVHAAAAVAVFVLARTLLADVAAPLVAGLLFAVHPVHVEAVAWVSSRNELLAGLFMAIALIAYFRARARGGRGAAVVCAIASVLALLSKETAIVLPLMAAVIETLPGRGRTAERVRGPLALAALTAAWFLLRSAMVHGHPDPHPLAWRLMTAPGLVANALRLLFVPFPLRVYHDVPIVKSPGPMYWLCLAVVVLWIGAAIRLRRPTPMIALGMMWEVIALLPVCGIAVMLQPALLAERTFIVPSIGTALSGAALFAIAERAGSGARIVTRLATGALVVLLAFLCVRQSAKWHDDLALASAMVVDAPNAVEGHANLGVAYERAARFADARAEYEKAVALAPGDHVHHRNLATAYGKLGRAADAEREFRAALRLDPTDADAHYGLGWLHARAARWEEARADFEAAIELRPAFGSAHEGLGTALLNLGRADDAIRESRLAVQLEPDAPEAHYGLALALGQSGRLAAAVDEFRAAIRLRPDWPEAHFDLGATLSRLDRLPEARDEFATVLRLVPPGSEIAGLARDALSQIRTP